MVFAPTGEFLCHIEAKEGYTVLEAGADYVLGQHEDDLGRPLDRAVLVRAARGADVASVCGWVWPAAGAD